MGSAKDGSGGTSSGYAPDPHFLTHHALRIKGFATSESLGAIVALGIDEVEKHLATLAQSGLALFREARSLWQLTPQGRENHRLALQQDIASLDIAALHPQYRDFLHVNETFKSLCGDWQLKDGQPNDHADSTYDSKVVSRLVDLNGAAQPLVTAMTSVVPRLAPYAGRLDDACRAVVQGAHHLFTGVMCGSFHDIWMELHEDLILTQGIDRAAEGSF